MNAAEYNKFCEREELARLRAQERRESESNRNLYRVSDYKDKSKERDAYDRAGNQNASKYSDEQVIKWHESYKQGSTLTTIANLVGCSPSTVAVRFRQLGLKTKSSKSKYSRK